MIGGWWWGKEGGCGERCSFVGKKNTGRAAVRDWEGGCAGYRGLGR